VNARAVVKRKRKSVERGQIDHGKPNKMAYLERRNRLREPISSNALPKTPKG
jgi:hypothetical protein